MIYSRLFLQCHHTWRQFLPAIHGSIISNGLGPSPLFLQIETLHVSSIPPKRLYREKACGDCWLVVSAFNYSWSVCMLTLHFGFGINNEKCLQFWDSKRDISLESAISMDESETITTQRCGHLVEPVPFDNFWEPYYLNLFHVMKVSIKIWWWKISFF